MPITCTPFGQTTVGEPVELYTLTNANGLEVRISTYGGAVVAFLTPDRTGALGDIVLGFDTLEGYLGDHPYFGSLIGRYGNRIARGRFELDGVVYELECNNGPNHLHGGSRGFHTKVWQATLEGATLGLSYVSAAGEAGYPGRLTVAVAYTLTDANELRIAYAARTDAPTVLNLTNHSYFNLAGSGTILDHEVQFAAGSFVAVDEQLVPTGEIAPVHGTPLDFTTATTIGARIHHSDPLLAYANGGYDHCLVVANGGDLSVPLARVYEPRSGRVLELFTTQPGVQFYSGNFLEGDITGKAGQIYTKHSGFCLETQHFPDSPNQPAFPSTILRPGERYAHTTIYRIGAV
jgi:aldose 1-epimerase